MAELLGTGKRPALPLPRPPAGTSRSYSKSAATLVDKDSPLGQAFAGCDRTLIRLQRRIDATERSYQRALRELERLQSTPQPASRRPARESAAEAALRGQRAAAYADQRGAAA
jgi:hypothetical protein